MTAIEKEQMQQVVTNRKALEYELETKLLRAKTDALIKAYKSGAVAATDIETMMSESPKNSWKDEFFMGLFSLPLVLAFIPGLQDATQRAFEIIGNTLPEFYVQVLLMMVAASWGLRKLTDTVMNMRYKKT